MSSPDLVDALVRDLHPTRRSAPLSQAMLAWCGFSGCLVTVVIMTVGPLCESVRVELLESPRLVLEVVIGVLAGVVSMLTGLELGVPGARGMPRLWIVPILLFGGWTLVVLNSLMSPVEAGAAAPMRAHCLLQILLVSLPSAAAALYGMRGRSLFAGSFTGLTAGAAAATLPVLWMEFSCMNEPIHALQFHLSAIPWTGLFTAFLAHRFRLKI